MAIDKCANCGGTHYGSNVCPFVSAPCVMCGEATIYACSDCAIDSGGTCRVHICGKASCQSQHDPIHADGYALKPATAPETRKPKDWIDPAELAAFDELKAALDPATRIKSLEAEVSDLKQKLADARHSYAMVVGLGPT